jgi:hypothetical protein
LWQDSFGSSRSIATAAAALAAVAWSGSATAAATAAKSTGFRATLGIHYYVYEDKDTILARIQPSFFQCSRVSKNPVSRAGDSNLPNAGLAAVAAAVALV